jgi:lipopolysaccharide/colanic/teichoic acid biosynthesis glycosyltransferase
VTAPPFVCQGRYPRAKRTLDVAVSIPALGVAFPLLVVAAVLIWIESPGSPLFVQTRVGLGGRPFRIYKLRSMGTRRGPSARLSPTGHDRPTATSQDGSITLGISPDDPRLTRMGRVLRRYSVDELPQLWNVVLGEMSLVGPRPHTTEDLLTFPAGYTERHQLPPGMTGLWQVRGRNSLSARQMLELDVRYVRNWCFRTDVSLLLATPAAVVRARQTA